MAASSAWCYISFLGSLIFATGPKSASPRSIRRWKKRGMRHHSRVGFLRGIRNALLTHTPFRLKRYYFLLSHENRPHRNEMDTVHITVCLSKVKEKTSYRFFSHAFCVRPSHCPSKIIWLLSTHLPSRPVYLKIGLNCYSQTHQTHKLGLQITP